MLTEVRAEPINVPAFLNRTVVPTLRGAWVTATAYLIYDQVTDTGGSYICRQNHTSSAATRPGVGASWTTYWQLVATGGTNGTNGTNGVDGLMAPASDAETITGSLTTKGVTPHGDKAALDARVAPVETRVTTLEASFGVVPITSDLLPWGDQGAVTLLADAPGHIVLAVDSDGRLADSAPIAREICAVGGGLTPHRMVPEKHNFVLTQKDWNVISLMGQSLARGHYARDENGVLARVTSTQEFNNKMLDHVVEPNNAATALTPLVEEVRTIGGLTLSGESVAAGATSQASYMLGKLLKPWESWKQDWIAGSWALSGSAIAQNIQGTAPYNNAKAYLTKAKALGGSSCVARGVLWLQGETDMANELPQADYTAALLDLKNDWQIDAAAITGQTDTIPFFMYQLSTQSKYASAAIPDLKPFPALAMLNLHETTNDMFLVCPMYAFNYSRADSITIDGVHLLAHSYRHCGAYFGKALHHVFALGKRWEPLRPLTLKQVGVRELEITYLVPVKPIVIDEALITNPGNYGFAVFNASSVEIAINRVWVSAADKITIRTATDLPASWSVSYAHKVYNYATASGRTSGSRGNIRDSDDTVSYYSDAYGVPYPLYNWSVIFKKVKTP
jgi:hypothetical protein